MIRIGFSRWFIAPERKSLPNGMVRHSIGFRPQAKTYRILDREWFGLKDSYVEKNVLAEAFIVSEINSCYDLKPEKEILLFKKLASEIASDAVTKCSYSGIVDSNNLNILTTKYVVQAAILRNVQYGIVDNDPTIDFIDLSADMRENMELRRRAEIERQARIERQAALWAERQEIITPKNKEERDKRIQTSLELLYSCISSAEKTECIERGTITVKNKFGSFIIPTQAHGFVKEFNKEGVYIQEHCIVFDDYSIPVGDEILMKTVLLKTDPERFMLTSNKFNKNRRS